MTSPTDRDDGFYRSLDSPSLVPLDPQPSYHDPHHSPAECAAMEEQWRADLAKLENEIATLRSVLGTKVRQANELKRRLGLTPLAELKRDLQQGVHTIRQSESYQKTNEKLHQIGETISSSDAYQKTNSAFKSFGSFASRKFGDFRNSNMFKSVEEKVGDAYSSVKGNLTMTRSATTSNDMPSSPIDSLLDDDEVYSSGASGIQSGSK